MQEMQDTQVSQDDPLEEGMATHSTNLAWRIPWTEEPDGLQSLGVAESDTAERLGTAQHLCAANLEAPCLRTCHSALSAFPHFFTWLTLLSLSRNPALVS